MTLHTPDEGRQTITMDLELALWDAPGNYHDETSERTKEEKSKQVRSLRRKPFGAMPAHDFLFDNFSALFGIGQHITLTPIQPEPLPYALLDVLITTTATANTVETSTTLTSSARWVWANLLSNWLQTALNVAAANCKTCLPTIGVWGQYRPNQLQFPEPTVRESVATNKQSSQMNRWSSSSASVSVSSPTTAVSGRSPLVRTSSSPPPSQYRSESSPKDALVGTTIQTEYDLARQLESARSRERQHRGGYARIHLFPQWAQACQNVKIPPEMMDQMWHRGMRSVTCSGGGGNSSRNLPQYAPPFFIGNVLTPFRPNDPQNASAAAAASAEPVWYRKGANMWVSAFVTNVHGKTETKNNNSAHRRSSSSMPSAASVLVGRPRLAVWAGVLLQHCPEDATSVLVGARHVFGWFKERHDENKVIKGGFLSSLANAASNSGGSLNYRSDSGLSKWRRGAEEDEGGVIDLTDDFLLYRQECHECARDILEVAWGCKDRRMPLWGSVDDPVASIYATTTWNGKSSGVDDEVVEPLLSFPLRIRSHRELSRDDWVEMEESVERTILDPMNPCRFCVQVFYDRDTSVSTLAANVRCVLAATIRAATLPDETLLHHLTDMDLIKRWDDGAGRQVAKKLAERANVGNGTRSIVEAMDWSTAIEEFISVREAEYAVHAVMNSSLTSGFPSCPDDSFNEHDFLFPLRKAAPSGRLLSALFAHMARLRSLSSVALVWRVFCQELRRRWDSRESLPNMQYIPGLDPHPLDLYEKRCFSTIGLKASYAAFLNCTEPDPDDYNCLIGQKLQVFQLGVECVVARELLENEAMENFLGAGQLPASLKIDDNDLEMKDGDVPSVEGTLGDPSDHLVVENVPIEKRKWPKAKPKPRDLNGNKSNHEKTNYGPPTIDRDLDFWVMDESGNCPVTNETGNFAVDHVDDTGFDYVAPPSSDLGTDDESATELLQGTPKKKKPKKGHDDHSGKPKSSIVVESLPNQAWEGTVMDGSDGSVGSTDALSQVYHDAAEAGSIFSNKNGFVSMETLEKIGDMKHRPGARCPVQGEGLAMTGDQLYAPYLQRPYPVTDDVALERRIMLANSVDGGDKRGVLQSRLEIAHRLQRPKLVSDMCAFKAANPKCTLDDFTKWYGNPGSPLDEYNDDVISDDISVQDAYNESAAKKLDKASEAMRVLVSTRDFWGKAWEEATPVPAAEQDPLFHYESTVEMCLDYLEQLHPTSLMNQVMAVNLSSAYFALASSAKGTMKIGIVQLSMKRLRQKIENALHLLSRDSTGFLSQQVGAGAGSGSTAGSTTTSHFTSEQTISACEGACDALSVAETMVARATSLLDKFPNQYGLVSDLLRFADGSTLGLTSRDGRATFLNAILEQQQKRNPISNDDTQDGLPSPMLREYVFRNLDEEHPCQLAVRFGDEDAGPDQGENEGGVLLALMKAYDDNGD